MDRCWVLFDSLDEIHCYIWNVFLIHASLQLSTVSECGGTCLVGYQTWDWICMETVDQ
jgi:hypothetical protein